MVFEGLAAWLRLSLTPGVGNEGARKLLAAFGLPENIFAASESALCQVVRPAQASALLSLPPEFRAQWARTQAWLEGDNLGTTAAEDRAAAPAAISRSIVTLGDPGYPAALLQMEDPPLLLYVMGQGSFASLPSERCIAMVGSRNPTPQGAENARHFAQALANAGLTVVSGLALGVDGAAHEGALAATATRTTQAAVTVTVAVVGTGLDRVYPKQHRDLAHQIALHGLLVSEYPLGTPPLSPNFPKRNRLIAGLSRATLVVEAALKSGSLITARLASEQGRDVLAIPGSIHAAQSRGCHALIKQGAKLVESADDVLEEFGWSVPLLERTANKPKTAAVKAVKAVGVVPPPPSSPLPESALLQALGHDPVGLDALQARTGLPTPELQAELLTLELDGWVARLPGGLFQRCATV